MKILYTIPCLVLLAFACSAPQEETHSSHESEHEHAEEVHLSLMQFEAMGLEIDTLSRRVMKGFVETNGHLILPPQSQAAVTSIVGANISSVEVIEGNKVNKGQILAYLYHPNLIKLQTEYANKLNQLDLAEQDYKRQERLYNESVGSGREFQVKKAEYISLKGSVEGMEAQLELLSISKEDLKAGKFYNRVALKSPINGFVQHISIRTGQYVEPAEVLFEISQNDHIYAHFKVFESNIQDVREGQSVQFTVESDPQKQHKAKIISVGKTFEDETKAVNIYADLDNEDGFLLPGMYARGQIIINEETTYALPKDAVVMDGERYYIFMAELVQEGGEKEWHFTPMEISIGVTYDDWVEIRPHEEVKKGTRFARNNAYYLISELMKEEAGHDH